MISFDKIFDELPDNALGDTIKTYIAIAETKPKDFQNSIFMGLVSKNPDALEYIRAHYPDEVKEQAKIARESSKINYRPELILNNLGYKDYDEMFGKNGWTTLTEPQLNTLILNAGLDKNKVKDFLKRGQAQYDRYKKYNSGLWKIQGFFSPRQHEALVAGREPTWTDFTGDVLENALYFVPVNRGIAYGARGIKALGKASPVARNRLNTLMYDVAGNAAVPFAVEGMDAALYDEKENPERSSFNLRDATTGAIVNATTPYMVGGAASMMGRKFGNKTGRSKVAEALTEDPYVEAIKREQEIANAPSVTHIDPSKANWKQERVDRTVLSKMEQDPAVLAQMGEQQYNDYIAKINAQTNTVPIINKETGDITHVRKPGDVALNTKREAILADIETLPDELADVRAANSKDFSERNPKEIYPSDRLSPEDKNLWGVDERGNIGYVVENLAHVAPEHGVVGYVPKGRSFSDLQEAARAKRVAEGKDPYYHVWTEGDEALKKAQERYPAEVNVPKVGFRSGLGTQMAKSYTTNKLGKTEYAKNIVPATLNEALDTHNIPADVRTELNNQMNIRMWEAGFVPNHIEGEPMWEAYSIWKKYNPDKEK